MKMQKQVQKPSLKKVKGYTLIELSIGIAIVALLVIGALAALPGVMFNNQAKDLNTEVNTIRSEVVNWKGYGRASFDTISIDKLCTATRKALPTGICGASDDGTAANPFGGDYSVSVNTTNKGRFDIKVTGVPSDKLDILADQFAPNTADACESAEGCSTVVASGTTITLTYGG